MLSLSDSNTRPRGSNPRVLPTELKDIKNQVDKFCNHAGVGVEPIPLESRTPRHYRSTTVRYGTRLFLRHFVQDRFATKITPLHVNNEIDDPGRNGSV